MKNKMTLTLLVLTISWMSLAFIPLYFSIEKDKHSIWFLWAFLSVIWIIPIFIGLPVKNSEGQYKGYVVAVEQSGAIFKGWNAYLKTELESSDSEKACIDRNNKKLIEELKRASETKKNITLKYEGVWQYKIGECPSSSWKIIEIIK